MFLILNAPVDCCKGESADEMPSVFLHFPERWRCRIECQIHEARISWWDLENRDLNFCATICMGIYDKPLLEQTFVAMNDS